MKPSVAVVIPTHVGRSPDFLLEAVRSVDQQSYKPAELCIAYDYAKQGAARTRQRALDMAKSEWVSFLDSDDYFLPHHLQALLHCAQETGADYVFSYFVRSIGGDSLGFFGKPFDPKNPHQTTITILVKRELACQVGFNNQPDCNPPDYSRQWFGEDWGFTLRCIELGAHIVHLPEETWVWRRHKGNTSGLPWRGDAL